MIGSKNAPYDWIIPDWPAPARVHAVTTTRTGGVSTGPYASMNLATHVGDTPDAVEANRLALSRQLGLPSEPVWLEQVHGTGICNLDDDQPDAPRADGAVATRVGAVCVVMTADCLPVLLCGRDGGSVAAAHAGWRGLAEGVLEAALDSLSCPPDSVLAWLGPAIGPQAFAVGEEVRQAFVDHDRRAEAAFHVRAGGLYADLYHLAQLRLRAWGVRGIHGGGRCTYTEAETFYSYRRDGATGRMASLIWIEQ